VQRVPGAGFSIFTIKLNFLPPRHLRADHRLLIFAQISATSASMFWGIKLDSITLY
jgi:hypothetical protein